MRRFLKFAGFAAVVVAGFTMLTAFGHARRHGPIDEARALKFAAYVVDDVLDDLDATDAQRQAIQALAETRAKDAVAFAKENDAVRTTVLEAFQGEPDAAKLHALVDARIEAMRVMGHKVTDDLIAARGVLTPEQRQKLAVMVKERAGE